MLKKLTATLLVTVFTHSAVQAQPVNPSATQGWVTANFLKLTGGTMVGDILFTDATYDIGKTGATRPRDIFYSRTGQGGTLALGGATIGPNALAVTGTATIAGNITASAANVVANGVILTSGASTSVGGIFPNGDGIIRLYNAAQTDFGRLQFGGTTSSFPALKRSSATLQARLADDSTYADFAAGQITAVGALISSGSLRFTSLGRIDASSDGVFVLNNAAANNFGRLQFGGTTSSFPAIKRSSTALHARLADDSDYAPFSAGVYSSGATAGIASCTVAVLGATVTITGGLITAFTGC